MLFTRSDWPKQALELRGAAGGDTVVAPSLFEMLVPALRHAGAAQDTTDLTELAASLGLLTRPCKLPADETAFPGAPIQAALTQIQVCCIVCACIRCRGGTTNA